jgi:molybdate transport system substrate-binding protein
MESAADAAPHNSRCLMLKVLAAGSVLQGMRAAAAAFSSADRTPVSVETDHGHNIEKCVLDGATDADLVAIPVAMLQRLAAAGRVDPTTLLDIGAVRIGAAVHETAVAPDLTTMQTLRNAVNDAREVLLTNAPTGEHLTRVFAAMALPAPPERKIRRFDTATALHAWLASRPNAGALGFAPVSEIVAWRGLGVALAGAIPDRVQIVLPYRAGMLAGSAAPDAAARLLSYLATPPARRCFADSGVEPASSPTN